MVENPGLVQINTQKFGCFSGFSTCLGATNVTRTDSLITAAVLPLLAMDGRSRKTIFLAELWERKVRENGIEYFTTFQI